MTFDDPTRQLPLFVYGTLLPGESNYRRYLAGRTQQELPATVAGLLWLVDAEDYPYLLPGDGIVHGLLVTLDPEAYPATLAAIDRLEDFTPGAPAESLYLRRQVTARLEQGELINAWTYVWNRTERPGRRLPHGDFRNRGAE